MYKCNSWLYKVNVAKCHLGKVKLEANAVSSLLLKRTWSVGWPQGPFANLVTYVASHGGIFELIFANLLLKPIFAYSGLQLQDRSSSRSTRSTRNSQDAALFVASATDSLSASATSLHPAVSSSQPVAGSMLSPSPEFLAPVVQAVKASLPAEQAFISHLDPSRNSSVVNQAIESSSSAMLGGIPSQNFSSQGFGIVDCRDWISNTFSRGPGIFITR